MLKNLEKTIKNIEKHGKSRQNYIKTLKIP